MTIRRIFSTTILLTKTKQNSQLLLRYIGHLLNMGKMCHHAIFCQHKILIKIPLFSEYYAAHSLSPKLNHISNIPCTDTTYALLNGSRDQFNRDRGVTHCPIPNATPRHTTMPAKNKAPASRRGRAPPKPRSQPNKQVTQDDNGIGSENENENEHENENDSGGKGKGRGKGKDGKEVRP